MSLLMIPSVEEGSGDGEHEGLQVTASREEIKSRNMRRGRREST